jgi:hypothetical protein
VRDWATLRYETRGPVAIVSLDRPECLNAYSVAMRDDLHAVLAAADADPGGRVVVLRGRGPAFSTGGDLREFGSAPSPLIARQVRWQRDVWGQLLGLRAISLAAVHGLAVGGGMEIALLCDVCLAADDARFALPETSRGMIPGWWTQFAAAGSSVACRRRAGGTAARARPPRWPVWWSSTWCRGAGWIRPALARTPPRPCPRCRRAWHGAASAPRPARSRRASRASALRARAERATS